MVEDSRRPTITPLARFQLSSLPLARMRLLHERVSSHDGADHSRWVFRDRKGFVAGEDAVVKLWNPAYIRRDNIARAIDAGFFDETTVPALLGLVSHDGVCRGYVIQFAKRERVSVEPFLEQVFHKTRKTGFFNVQLSPAHVGRSKNGLTLLDLEGVYAIDEWPRLSIEHAQFEREDYAEFVWDLYGQAHPEERTRLGETQGLKASIRPPSPKPTLRQRVLKRLHSPDIDLSLCHIDGVHI